jgi:hypothetical protein
MTTPPAGISHADRQVTPAGVRTLILSQQKKTKAIKQVDEQLRAQLTVRASELTSLGELFSGTSRNTS